MFFMALLAAVAAYLVTIVVLGIAQGLASTKMGHVGELMMGVQPYRSITNGIRFGLSVFAGWVAFAWVMG